MSGIKNGIVSVLLRMVISTPFWKLVLCSYVLNSYVSVKVPTVFP